MAEDYIQNKCINLLVIANTTLKDAAIFKGLVLNQNKLIGNIDI